MTTPNGHPPSPGWSTTNQRMVVHQKEVYLDGQLDLVLDSTAAQLVNLVVILAQLVSLSVTPPGKLVVLPFLGLFEISKDIKIT